VSRSERLLDLLQILRRHRRPVSALNLAEELGVSLRTLYRDIASLRARGAPIEGEAGVGYILRPGFTLPPLMFSQDELEALALGSRWVINRADQRLGTAARNALAKIAAVLPTDLRDDLHTSPLLVGPHKVANDQIDLADLRKAIRSERKVSICYRDSDGAESTRIIWPFAIGYFENTRLIAAWCELRKDFRHFRSDRITEFAITEARYPRRWQALFKDWYEAQEIPRLP
jgi:predicted DNA-binding transcriptional regulator YafY